MQSLTLDELDRRWVEIEAAVDATPAIDPWCSGPDWQLPSHLAFAPGSDPLILATDDGTGFALLARYRTGRQTTISGLEPLWGFGCPIIGPDPAAVVTELTAHLAADHRWDTIVIPGLPPLDEDQATAMAIAAPLAHLGRAGLAEGIARQVADLADGHDGWLSRRSPRFRRNLRKAEQAADRAGLHIVDAAGAADLFDRLLAIERRSWKGQEGSGITGPEMTVMYRAVVDRLAARHRLAAHIAILDGNEVGYIVGGVRAGRYRGLQLSYAVDAVDLSVGNLLQAHQLTQLTQMTASDRTGSHPVGVYDLGMDIDYKRRWADRAEPSAVLVIQR